MPSWVAGTASARGKLSLWRAVGAAILKGSYRYSFQSGKLEGFAL
jgi:hypothetical protein